jgi:hypothetical protein
MVPNTPKRRQGVQITDRETIKTDCPSIKGNPSPPKRQKHGVQKLALNIVHAVEFSRNGRTQVRPLDLPPGQPLHYSTSMRLHPDLRPGSLREPQRDPPSKEERFTWSASRHLRLEATESQMRLRGCLAKTFARSARASRSWPPRRQEEIYVVSVRGDKSGVHPGRVAPVGARSRGRRDAAVPRSPGDSVSRTPQDPVRAGRRTPPRAR